MSSKFEVLFLEGAREFLLRLDDRTRIKILYNIDKSKILYDPKLFKKLNDEIWEFRTHYNGPQYRLLAFWDKTEVSENACSFDQRFYKKDGQGFICRDQ